MKLTPHGSCQQFEFAKFHQLDCPTSKEIQTLQKLDNDNFVFACVMAGCEYLQNIERVGLKVALKHFGKLQTFDKVIEYLQWQKTFKDRVSTEYKDKAIRVSKLFKYQTVYDMPSKTLR